MTRDRKKSYVHTSVLIASDVMPTDGICLNINAPSIPRNKTAGPAQTIPINARSALQAVGLDLIMLNCLWFYHCRCAGVAWMVSCSACMVQYITRLYICHCLYIMSPALLCKSSIQSGNSEQCVLAFTHLLSSSCT